MEATKGFGKSNIKGAIKGCFIFNSWCALKRSAESATDVGADIIDMVKTNTKIFCKDTMNKLTNYWPGGSYLLLKRNSTVPGYRGLLAVGYKYNY